MKNTCWEEQEPADLRSMNHLSTPHQRELFYSYSIFFWDHHHPFPFPTYLPRLKQCGVINITHCKTTTDQPIKETLIKEGEPAYMKQLTQSSLYQHELFYSRAILLWDHHHPLLVFCIFSNTEAEIFEKKSELMWRRGVINSKHCKTITDNQSKRCK